jgi:hypothetical protein
MTLDDADSNLARLSHTLRAVLDACGHLDLDNPHCLDTLEHFRSDRIAMRWQDWAQLRHEFTIGETVTLAQILSTMEREFKCSGGSVSSVIWIMKDLLDRERRITELLADWLVQRTENDYLPFGSHASRQEWIRTRTPCTDLAARRAQAAISRRSAKAPSLASAVREAEVLAQAAETAKAAYLIQKSQESQPAQTVGKTVSPVRTEWLRLVALDLTHKLDFFPKEWAKVSDDDLLTLEPAVRAALVERVRTTSVVTWHRLYKRLTTLKPEGMTG